MRHFRAIRAYQAALTGQTGEADLAQLHELIIGFTGMDRPTVQEMVPPGMSPNRLPDRDSLLHCYRFFREQGLIPEPLTEAARAGAWGMDPENEVLDDLGRMAEK
jgi:hypothetical protein